MIDNINKAAVILDEDEVSFLWSSMLNKFIANTGTKLDEIFIKSPETFWGNRRYKLDFINDFNINASYAKCKIPIDADLEEGQKNIREAYLINHLIKRNVNTFQYGYLNRMIFYITGKKEEADWQPFFRKKGFQLLDISETQNTLPQGVEYLDGYWISFNGNIDVGYYAQCFYHFQGVGAVVNIEKDGYGAETKYRGEVAIQADSSYLFELTGEKRKLRKFIIADVGKIKPDVMTCFSSAFGIGSNKPVLAKEILVRLPEDAHPRLDGGVMVKHAEIGGIIEQYYQREDKEKILKEITEFLGENEVPYFTLDNLKNIKKRHLEKIEIEKIAEPKVLKKQSIYVHFNRLSCSNATYLRNVIKYFKESKASIKENIHKIQVEDEYTLMRICQYNKEEVQKHNIRFEAEYAQGVVDIQSLFPIVADNLDNDLKQPVLKYSNLVVDALSDTFVSSATFINDFSKTKRIGIHFDEKTLRSELIFDFSSIEDFDKLNIGIAYLSYHFNEPDARGMQEIKIEPQKINFKGAILTAIDRKKLIIEKEESLDIDRDNHKIFALKIDFPAMKDEILYVHFKLNNNQ